ncbi:MAG: hypothetical protein QOI91_2225 [Solirubrobacteraceae bacterium]|nr:hypothetical protein [Solirubrobacteraceae bacterium]
MRGPRVIAAVLAAILLAPAGAAGKVLRGSSGFQVSAPAGYRLKSNADGTYEVSSRRGRVVYSRLRTAVKPGDAGAALLNQLGLARNSARATSTTFQADLGDAADRRRIAIRREGRNVLRATMTIARSATRLGELDRIVASARGGRIVVLRRGAVREVQPRYPIAPIQRNQYVHMDVPRGFNASPSDTGAVFLSNRPGQPEGSAAFGVPALIVDPNQYLGCQYGPQYCGGPCDTVYRYTNAADALVNVLPRELANLQCRAGVPEGQRKLITNMRASQLLADGPLGPPYSSGGVYAHFNFAGRPWSAVVLVGTAYIGSDSPYWLLYYSYIAVPDPVAGLRAGIAQNGEDRTFQRQLIGDNLAQSLMQSWRSWQIDPSVQNARFQTIKMSIDQTTATIREAHEFRVETYSRVNEKWSAYIRYSPPPDDG